MSSRPRSMAFGFSLVLKRCGRYTLHVFGNQNDVLNFPRAMSKRIIESLNLMLHLCTLVVINSDKCLIKPLTELCSDTNIVKKGNSYPLNLQST